MLFIFKFVINENIILYIISNSKLELLNKRGLNMFKYNFYFFLVLIVRSILLNNILNID